MGGASAGRAWRRRMLPARRHCSASAIAAGRSRQIKSALVLTGKPVLGPGGAEADTTREGGGTIDLVRADRPLVFASPSEPRVRLRQAGRLFCPPGLALRCRRRRRRLDRRATTLQQSANGVAISVPPVATVPGPLVIAATASPAAAEGHAHRFRRPPARKRPRRIPFWFRVAAPKLGLEQRRRSRAPVRTTGTRAGMPPWSTSYRYPDDARIARRLAHACSARSRCSAFQGDAAGRELRRGRRSAGRTGSSRASSRAGDENQLARRDRRSRSTRIRTSTRVRDSDAGGRRRLPRSGRLRRRFRQRHGRGSRCLHIPLLDQRHDSAAPSS